jgi:hypothetical protein
MLQFESYTDVFALHRQPETFAFRLVGTSGCEIVGPEGVIAWTTDGYWAAVIVALLNRVEGQDPSSPATRHVPMPDERNPSVRE